MAFLSESDTTTLLAELPAPVWMADESGAWSYFNAAWLEFTGREAAEEQGDGWQGGLHPADRKRVVGVFSSALSARADFRVETRLRGHDGGYRWFEMKGTPRFEGEEFRGYVGVCADVTDRVREEEKLRALRSDLSHVARLGTMGEMSTAFAHEIKQPLTAISTYSRLCGDVLRGTVEGRRDPVDLLTDIHVQAHRAGEMIRRWSEFARKREPHASTVVVEELVAEAVELVGPDLRGEPISLRITVEKGLPTFLGDTIQLQQVLVNLIRNAVDGIQAAETKPGEIEIGATAGRKAIVLTVTDDGRGFGSADPEHCFRPFYTTKRDGLGIGLWICRTIVESHGGRLVGRKREKGAEFRVELPVS